MAAVSLKESGDRQKETNKLSKKSYTAKRKSRGLDLYCCRGESHLETKFIVSVIRCVSAISFISFLYRLFLLTERGCQQRRSRNKKDSDNTYLPRGQARPNSRELYSFRVKIEQCIPTERKKVATSRLSIMHSTVQ